MSEEKEKTAPVRTFKSTKNIFFETTYEKVLFIINKVKDYIKNISSNESKLIEE